MKFYISVFLVILFVFSLADIIVFSGNSKLEKLENINEMQKPEKITNDLSKFDDMEIIDKELDNFMRKWEIVGAVVAILKDDKLVYAHGFGYADKGKKELVQPFHRFRIASASKLITAVAIMKLVEEHKLDLDEKVFGKTGILNDKAFLNYTDKRFEKITVEQLLRHQGGWTIRYGDQMFMAAKIAEKLKVKSPPKLDDIIRFALSKSLHFEPGSYSAYSNFGYCVLGKVIEIKTGKPYDTYVNDDLLKPLGIFGMQLAGITRAEKLENEVVYYDQEDAEKVPSCFGTGGLVERCYGGTDYRTLGPAGGWITNVSDLAKLISYIDGYPEVKDILSSGTIENMTYATQNISPVGWRKTNKDGEWWRTGTLAGTTALIKRENDGICYIVLTNTGTWKGPKFYPQTEHIMRKILSSIKKWPDQDLFMIRDTAKNSSTTKVRNG